MLRIHQPYKSKYIFAFASIGVFLLGSLAISGAFSESSTVQAAEIKYMQQFTNLICQSMSTGDTMDLIDPRGESEEDFQTYKVIRMQDGTCWMAENLRLPAETKIIPKDSDVISDWTLPTNASVNSSTMNWGSDNNAAYMAEGSTSMKVNSGGAWKEAYGNYYSWCAATAMSCLTNRTGAALNDTDAAESICPKNWKLPAYSGTQSFQNLYGQYPNSAKAGWATNQTISYNGGTSAGYNGLKLGFNSVDAFFPAAGLVYSDGLSSASSDGYYWSRRAYSVTSFAYDLNFYSSDVQPQYIYSRYYGLSVRCVADPSITTSDFTYEGDIYWEESLDGNVKVNVPSILTIDATSGMDEIADASKIIEGTATATVSSNTEYTVTLYSTEPSLKDVDNSANTSEISAVSESNPVQPGYNAWGFWDGSSMSGSDKLYTIPLTISGREYYNTIEDIANIAGDPAKKYTYYVGISISSALPSGTYGTDVVITASVK